MHSRFPPHLSLHPRLLLPGSLPSAGTITITINIASAGLTGSRCGAPLPLAALGEAARPAEFLAYRTRLRERRTPPAERLYCHDRERCGMFLLPPRSGLGSANGRGGGGSGTAMLCPLCGRKTCEEEKKAEFEDEETKKEEASKHHHDRAITWAPVARVIVHLPDEIAWGDNAKQENFLIKW
ncbi:hypothetical protein P885DRAFT_57790 [Corynascus similis CBS 632.67]